MSEHDPTQADALTDETTRRSRLFLHTLPIFGIPLVVSAATFLLLLLTHQAQLSLPPGDAARPNPLVPVAIMVVFFSALIILARLKRPTISALLLIGVWTLVTTLETLQSGTTSYTPALLIIPICAAGLLIDAVASVSLAVLATVLMGTLVWLETNGYAVARTLPSPFVFANESYRAFGFWVALFATVAALTSVLAGGLQRALQHSRAQAAALQALSSQLEARVETQTARLIAQEREAATLEERARLAREIHDTLAQGLTGIVVQLGAAQRALGAGAGADQHIGLAQAMAREALAEARRSVWNLRAPALMQSQAEQGHALGDALRTLAERPIRPEISIGFEQRGQAWQLPPAAESALLRVGQEALMNAAKHSDATQIAIVLEYTPELVRLSISDNGVGFEEGELPQATPAPGPWGGFGLMGMRERMGTLGGSLELSSNGGAHVVAVVPRPPSV